MKIAIVDDNLTNLMIIEKIMKQAGYHRLELLSSARELYQYLQLDASSPDEVAVDLILMDLMMPEIDGIEACRTILAQERYEDLPIIFVTAMGDSYKMAEAMDAGALDYVMKPINKVELLARVRSVLRIKKEKDLRKEREKRIQYELDLAKEVQRSMLSGPLQEENVNRFRLSTGLHLSLPGTYTLGTRLVLIAMPLFYWILWGMVFLLHSYACIFIPH